MLAIRGWLNAYLTFGQLKINKSGFRIIMLALLNLLLPHQVQDLGRALIELWNLMDTPIEEQKRFDHVTHLITSTVDDVVRQECLSVKVIEQVIIFH